MDMVSIHSLSELERLKLQETAYHELVARHFLSEFKPDRALPDDHPNTLEKWFLMLRGQEREASFKTFGIRLEEVLVNELTRRKHLELTAAMQVEDATGTGRRRRGNVVQRMFGRMRRFFSRRRNTEPTLPREFTRRGRRGAVSVDSLAEMENGALLLRTLQLSQISFPIGQRLLGSKRKMSLNPIAQQVPQVVETCCKFIEKHGLSSVGIFTIEYSLQNVVQLRELFDKGLDIVLDDNLNVHDVAALLKEFFREMKDSLLPDDLYMSFLLTATLKPQDQVSALQLLVYLMPPCHSDTLERLLKALHKITENCEDSIGVDGQLVPGNRMTSTNLALVFGTALLKKGKLAKRESRKTKLGIDHYVASVNVVRAMIDNWDILFKVPPHIQKQVAKRVWKSSPEALDFIRRRNLRKIQSARIKMEEDALLSDPVENSAEAQAAILAQSQPFDEDPEGAPDMHDILNFGDSLDYDLEDESDFEDQDHLDLAEVPYLDVIPNNEDADSDADEIPGNDEVPDINETPDNVNAPNNDEPQDLEEIPSLEEISAADEVPNDESSNEEEIPDHEEYPEVNGMPESEEDLDFDEVPALHVVPSPEEAPTGHGIPNQEESPEVNGLSHSEEDTHLEDIPDFDGILSDEETSDAEETPDQEEAPEVNGIVDLEDAPNPEEVPALHVIAGPEDISDSGEIQEQEDSSEVSGATNNEEASDDEEHGEASRVSGNQDSEKDAGLEGDSVASVVPQPEDAEIQSESLDLKKDQVGAIDEDEVSTVDPETEDVSILSTVPDLPQDVAVNLEDVMNVEVPVPEDLNTKKVQNQKAIWFQKDGADIMFPAGSSQEPAVPRGTARSHGDEEGAGKPPNAEQDRPLLRVPREKEGKSGIGFFP